MKLHALGTAAVLLLSLGCHPGVPVIDSGPKPDVGGSISGRVVGTDGSSALSARRVTAVNVATGARFDVSTATNGGYTVRVPPGMYRLEVELRPGERLATEPESTDVDAGDLDAGRDFVVALATQR